MRRHWMVKIVFVMLSICEGFASAQEHSMVSSPNVIDSIQPRAIPFAVESHSPRKAFLLSFLPGAGQVYNGQAWKVPIIYGGFAVAGYFIYSNYGKMKDFRDEYLLRINGGTPEMPGYANYPNTSIYNYYQSYNQSYQLSIVFAVIIYALNLVDAFVYGHLYEFQINDDISMSLRPNVQPNLFGTSTLPITTFSCSISF